MLRLSDVLRAGPDEDAVATLALRLLAEALGLDLCCAVSMHPAEDRADVTHQFRRSGGPPVPATLRMSDVPEALRQTLDRTLVVNDTARGPGLTDPDRRSLASMRFGALVAAPLRRGEGSPVWSLVAAMT